jgi:hypothetical protein
MRASRHAVLLAILTVAFNGNGRCQSRLEVLLTNRMVTFTNLQGQVAGDASLIRATADEVVFKTNDVYGTVKFTNLAPQVLEYLGVPQSHLKLVRDRQAQLPEQAARESEMVQDENARLLDPANLVKVTVESVVWTDYDALYGTVQRCNLRMTNGEAALVFLARLPAAVPDFVNQRQSLSQTVAWLTNQVEMGRTQVTNDTALVNAAKKQKGVKGIVRADLDAAEGNLLTAKKQLDAWNSQLKQAQHELDALNKKDPSGASVLAMSSQFKHNGSPMMICSTNQVQTTAKAPETTARKKKSK